MRIAVALVTVGLFIVSQGCRRIEEARAAEGADCSNCPESLMTSATETPPATELVKGMTLSDYTPISSILAAPQEFEGKRVLVKGEAVAVCETRGCWVNLKSEADNAKALRVKVEDGEIVFPLTVKGNEVQVEGVVEKMVIAEADYRALLEKRAADKGESFDPASVKGPKITWQLRGLAAKF